MVLAPQPDDETYLSRVEASELLGIGHSTLDYHIRLGDLPVARPGLRSRKSLRRLDVEQFGRWREQTLEAARQARAERDRKTAERADPPEGEWLSTVEAAELLGCSSKWVRRLARRGRLPCVVRGQAYRYRRDLIELVANAWYARIAERSRRVAASE